jgi:hypothetical protein
MSIPAKSSTSPKPARNASIASNIIYCPRSGLALARVEALCSHGWPVINTLSSAIDGLLHPVYAMPLEKLIVKLKHELEVAESIAWCSVDSDQLELRLSISAIMYAIDAIWQPHATALHLWKTLTPSLPSWDVTVATGGRLLKLVSWYHYATSKRLEFPLYRISAANNNLTWQNLASWVDEAFEIKTAWETGKSNLNTAEQIKARTDALLTVNASSVYKRIDLTKVWNWIDIQMKNDPRYPAGRRETFKTIFMSADSKPEEWNLDDVEDVQIAILETCDVGNEIMFFIRTRLNNTHAIIRDFYSSFTLLSNVAGQGTNGNQGTDEVTKEEREATSEFFAGFDRKAEALDVMPPEPKRDSFATLPKFLQAQAQWRILSRRHDMKNGGDGKVKPAVAKPSIFDTTPDAPF